MRIRLLIYLVAASCFLSVFAYAQNSERPTRAKNFRNSKRFVQSYDKFKDITTVSVGPFSVGGTGEYMMTNTMFFLEAAFTYQGQKLEIFPEHFWIALEAEGGKDWRFLKDSEVIAIADGERFNFGEAHRDSDLKRFSVKERLTIEIPSDSFIKIGKAKEVEIKFGTKVLKLKDEHLEAFRDLTSLAQPEKKASP